MRGLRAASIAVVLSAGQGARAEALPCEADDRLTEAAARLLLRDAPLDSPSMLTAARAEGFDGVSLHARESERDETLRAWLDALGARERGRLMCGEARSASRRLLLAAVRGGALWRAGDRVYGRLEPGFAAPALVLEAHDGTLAAMKVSASELERGVPIAAEQPPARVQLTAETDQGPKPVAELRLDEGYDEVTAPRSASRVPGAAPKGALLAEIGAFRRTVGAASLRDNRLLARSAQGHAARVCELGTLAHRLEGEDPEARLARERIAARAVGEVIARADDPDAALRVLLASPSHRMALSRRAFTDVGLGQSRDAKGRTCLVVLLAAWPRRTP